nr:outer membrane protein assembly factor BamA [Meinhardsimonia xiamenensis]
MTGTAVGARIRSLFIILFVSLCSIAMPERADAQSYRFSNVRIEGNENIEAATVLSYLGIAPGETVSAGELNAAYQRLVASGLFETVELEPAGGTLVIRVTEWPVIREVSIEGNKRLDDDTLLAVIQSQPARVYSPSVAEADAAAIAEAYLAAGRLAASVTPKIIRPSNNRVDLVFEVAEGGVTEVERLSFVGNRAFTDRQLRRALETKQAGVLRALIRADTLVPDRLEFDKQKLRDFYLQRGYIDFRILSVTSEFSRERNAVFVTFTLHEGQQFRFGKLTVSSDLPEVDVERYQREVKIRPGKVYTPQLLEATITRLELLATQQGLRFVRVEPRVTRNDAELTLDVDFQLVRGPRVFIERIDIEGNTTTLDRVIRRQFRVAEGDPFNPREIQAAARRIRELDYFETVEVSTEEGSGPDQVIVKVKVVEKPTGSLSFGASYTTGVGIGLNASLTERNFLGRGQTLEFSVQTGGGTQSGSFSFLEPAFLGRDVAFGLDLAYTQTDNASNSSYDSRIGVFRPSLTFPLSEYADLGLRATVRASEMRNVSPNSSAILTAEQGLGMQYQFGPGYTLSFDNRAGGLNPDAGVLVRFNQDFYVAGEQDFIQSTLLFVAERKMLTRDVTFRAVLEGGALYSLSGDVTKATERFFLSANQLRGFDVGGVGPRDLNVSNQDALGGNYYAVARFEVEFPLPLLPDEYGISGGAFFDVGSLWGLDNTAGGPAGANPVDDSFHLRSSIGLSVFWETPIGPLRFNFSKPLVKQPYDRERFFDLTVSTEF